MKRKIFIISGICAAVWLLIISMVVILLAAVASSASEEFVTDYQRAAELINGSWQAILAFDTVRYDNELDDADPNLSAMEFMIIDYKKVPLETWQRNRRKSKTGSLDTGFLRYSEYGGNNPRILFT